MILRLVGGPGAGKTSVGIALMTITGVPFLSGDEIIGRLPDPQDFVDDFTATSPNAILEIGDLTMPSLGHHGLFTVGLIIDERTFRSRRGGKVPFRRSHFYNADLIVDFNDEPFSYMSPLELAEFVNSQIEAWD
jgi:hypothetical protein